MSDRVTVDDLLQAAEWLAEGFEPHPDGSADDVKAQYDRVAEWLRSEAERREIEQLARLIAGRLDRPVDAAIRTKARAIRAKNRELHTAPPTEVPATEHTQGGQQ